MEGWGWVGGWWGLIHPLHRHAPVSRPRLPTFLISSHPPLVVTIFRIMEKDNKRSIFQSQSKLCHELYIQMCFTGLLHCVYVPYPMTVLFLPRRRHTRSLDGTSQILRYKTWRSSASKPGGRVGGESGGIPPPCSLPTATFHREPFSPKKSTFLKRQEWPFSKNRNSEGFQTAAF